MSQFLLDVHILGCLHVYIFTCFNAHILTCSQVQKLTCSYAHMLTYSNVHMLICLSMFLCSFLSWRLVNLIWDFVFGCQEIASKWNIIWKIIFSIFKFEILKFFVFIFFKFNCWREIFKCLLKNFSIILSTT